MPIAPPPKSRSIQPAGPRKILVIDDDPSVLGAFRKILEPQRVERAALSTLENSLFEGRTRSSPKIADQPTQGAFPFVLTTASQGQEGLREVQRMQRQNTPFSLAFVDMRMPPGWDGVETIAHLWQVDTTLPIIICSAFSDYSWHDVIDRFKRPDLRMLPKPFETKDVLEMAYKHSRKA
jgi:CheY-like chemotaxis protein